MARRPGIVRQAHLREVRADGNLRSAERSSGALLRHLWAPDGSVAWNAKHGIERIYNRSMSRHLTDDVSQLLLRFGFTSRAHATRHSVTVTAGKLALSGVNNQGRGSYVSIDVHGVKFFAAREVLTKLAAVSSNVNVDTVPR